MIAPEQGVDEAGRPAGEGGAASSGTIASCPVLTEERTRRACGPWRPTDRWQAPLPLTTSDPDLRGPVLALDLGGTRARAAVVNAAGQVLTRRSAPTPMAEGVEAVLAACDGLLREVLEEHLAVGGTEPVAVGIAAPGPLHASSGTLIDPPNLHPGFRGLPLGPRIGDRLGLPWALERDTNVALLGEARFGAGRSFGDLVYLTISTGIGGAVMTDGRLLAGPDGVAGELGHMVVDMDGPTCGCGADGHLEALASGTGIARAARDGLAAGADGSHLARIAARLGSAPLSAAHVAEAEDLGDRLAAAILDRARRALAAAIVSIVDIFDPDRVICGGGISLAQGDRLLGPARVAVERTAFRTQAARARVVVAALGDDSGLIGTVPLVGSALPGASRRADSPNDGPGQPVRPAPGGPRARSGVPTG
jgi:glucokinase